MAMTVASTQQSSSTQLTSGRVRIHAISHRLVARTFAYQLAAFCLADLAWGVFWLARGEAKGFMAVGLLPLFVIATVSAHRAAVRGAPTIFATREGLQFGSGDDLRCFAWQQIREVALVPLYLTTPSVARTYEVELVDGSKFRFVGRKTALRLIAKARFAVGDADKDGKSDVGPPDQNAIPGR